MASANDDDREKVQFAPVVLGLTRPRMMLGVRFELFIAELMVCMLLFLNIKSLLIGVLFPVMHAASYLATIRDTRLPDVVWVKLRKCMPTRNRMFWGGNSYSP